MGTGGAVIGVFIVDVRVGYDDVVDEDDEDVDELEENGSLSNGRYVGKRFNNDDDDVFSFEFVVFDDDDDDAVVVVPLFCSCSR